MLFDRKVKSRGMIGFFVYLHITSFLLLLDDGLSSQGIFGKLVPFTIILLIHYLLKIIRVFNQSVPVL